MAYVPGKGIMRFNLLASIVALILQGCAAGSQQAAGGVDWHAIGYADGMRGSPAQQITVHRKASRSDGSPAELLAYRAGRDAGLRIYCDPRNGYAVGSQGGHYSGVCPADLEPAFVEAYAVGRSHHAHATRPEQTAMNTCKTATVPCDGVPADANGDIVDDFAIRRRPID